MHPSGSFIFLADFLDKTASYEVLKFFISTQPQHFLATAHGVANFEIGENALEKIVKAKHLLFGKDITKLVGNMVGKSTR